MVKKFNQMDDSEKIQHLDIILKQVKDLQEQINTLTQAMKNKQDQVISWKGTAVTKFNNTDAEINTIKSRLDTLEGI